MTRVESVPIVNTKPWASGFFLLSFLAYPGSKEKRKQRKFYGALMFKRDVRHVEKSSRDIWIREDLAKIIRKGYEMATRHLSAGEILACQILNAKREGLEPTLRNLEQFARKKIGWDTENVNTTYTTKVWVHSRPVLHLATAVVLYLWDHKPHTQHRLIGRLFGSYAAQVEVLKLTDILRGLLPHYQEKYREDAFIKFEFAATESPIVDEESRQWQAIFAGFKTAFDSAVH